MQPLWTIAALGLLVGCSGANKATQDLSAEVRVLKNEVRALENENARLSSTVTDLSSRVGGLESDSDATVSAPTQAPEGEIDIRITSDPSNCKVQFNGEDVGRTPLAFKQRSRAKLHKVRVLCPGYKTVEREIDGKQNSVLYLAPPKAR